MPKIILFICLTLLESLWLSCSWAQTETQTLIVQFQSTQGFSNPNPEHLTIIKPQKHQKDIAIFQFKAGVTLSEKLLILQQIRQRPEVRWATFDAPIATPQFTPNDTYIEQQSNWQTSIRLPQTWDLSTDCSQIIIGVLDSGVDLQHPDLKKNLWQNPEEIPNNGLDDDQNGYIDDVNGWNAIKQNGDVTDYYGHGTHVAGLISATGNNQQGVAGGCWQTQLLPLKFLNQYGGGSLANAAAAIYYLITLQQQFPNYHYILNNSWAASSPNLALEAALNDAIDASILVINAAGNSGQNLKEQPTYPAQYAKNHLAHIAVANLNTDVLKPYTLHSSSNYGLNLVTLSAPGTEILSTWPRSLSADDIPYQYETGTSMAAPIVSGVAALIWQANPDLRAADIRALLVNQGIPQESLKGKTKAPVLIDSLAAYQARMQTQTELGYLQLNPLNDGTLQLKGSHLDKIQNLQLNHNQSIDYQVQDSDTLTLLQPEQLRCGYLSATTQNQTSVTPYYLEWQPKPPTEIQVSTEDNHHYQLSWNTDPNVDKIEIEAADNEGQFHLIQTVANTTQLAEVTIKNQAEPKIRLKSLSNCLSPQDSTTTVSSSYSQEILLGAYPIWQTQSIGGARQNHTFRLPIKVKNAQTVSIDLDTPINNTSPCLPEGIEFHFIDQQPLLSGVPTQVESCDFTLVATSADNLKSRKTFHLTVNADTAPLYWSLTLKNQHTISVQFQNPTLTGIRLDQSSENTDGANLNWWYGAEPTSDNIQLKFDNKTALVQWKWLDDSPIQTAQKLDSSTLEFSLEPLQITAQTLQQKTAWRSGVTLEIQSINQTPSSSHKSQDWRCFIASSIYGNYRSPDLNVLRKFRDQILASQPIGRQFIQWYYQNAPKWIHWSHQHPVIFKPIHTLLWAQIKLFAWEIKVFTRAYQLGSKLLYSK